MYRILIVDDEAVEREVVRFLINQYDFPLDISEAVNGKDALEQLKEQRFDILLTDIRMPFLDGLVLSNKARELYPDIHILFFSGYDDFSYVKEALSLQVVNYILKPIDSGEFQRTILDVLERIRTRERLTRERKAVEDFTRNHVLYQLVNKTDIKRLEALFPQLDLTFVYACHRLFLIQLEHDFFGMSSEDADFFSLDLQQMLPEDCYFINLNPSQNLLLFTGQKRLLSWYQDLADRLAFQIQKTCQANCFISISNPIAGPQEIPQAYEEAERQLMERFFFAGSTLVDEESSISLSTAMQDDTILNQLRMDIQFKDTFSLKKHMSLLIDAFKREKQLSHIYFRFFCTNVMKLLLDGFPQNMDKSFEEYANVIYRSTHLSKIESLLLRLTDELAGILEREQESPKYVLQKVKQYIHNHYSEDLSLDILAKEVYLTPRYLSALFIEETGCGINRYIKRVRMEKAQELLLNTNLKVNDICQKVGYSNLSYFCKSFAEEFGTTPNNFRHMPPTIDRS